MTSLSERAQIIPGGSLTRSKKVFGKYGRAGYGAYVTDTDGKDYIDMVCALGARSLNNDSMFGYEYGVDFGVYSLPQYEEIQAAEAVLRHVAQWASHVRFTKTGSEATHAAYRIAKTATGRDVVVRFPGSYHGWHEWCASKASGYSEGDSPIAAVFIEPPRFEPVDVAWLIEWRMFCNRTGALLIFDEMIWGGRWALGGCTEYCGVQPDLACYGKAFGNGQSVAFVVGRDALAEHGEMVSGTFSGDTVGLEAVCRTLDVYTSEPVIETLWSRARQLHAGFSTAVPASFATLTGPAPLMGIRYANPEQKQAFSQGMLDKGVLVYPDWFMTMFAHSEANIDRVVQVAGEVAHTLS